MAKLGKQTIALDKPVKITAVASVTGPKEGKGPLGKLFDVTLNDEKLGEDSWEKAESRLVEQSLRLVTKKAGLQLEELDIIFAGDLLNQEIGSTFGVRALKRPLLGLFGACSTFGEALIVGSAFVGGGFAEKAALCASSHFCAAERQFRFPLEFGGQRPPAGAWTVTGSGAATLTSDGGEGVYVTAFAPGKVVDLGVDDVNNMGAAMSPAAADTIMAYFRDANKTPADFDAIVTGDLGYVGRKLLIEICANEGFDLAPNHADCGIEIFDKSQDAHAGGSGCGCSAVVFAAKFYDELKNGKLSKILFCPTGALLSCTSVQQGETIPAIAHCVIIERL